jgi:anti-sigma B factor antagonist
MLRIVVERSMDSALLRCSGRLVAGEEVLRLREAVMCQADKRSVQLDLAGVETVDAAGLGLLVSLHSLGRVVGFELQVRHPVRRVCALLKLTGLESVLEIQPPNEVELPLSAGASSNGGDFGGNFKGRTKSFHGPRALALDPLPGSGSENARSRRKWVCDA